MDETLSRSPAPLETNLDLDLNNLMKKYGIQNFDGLVPHPKKMLNQSKSGSAKSNQFIISNHGYEKNRDVYEDFRPLVIMGSIIGLIPFSGVWSRSSTKLSFKRLSLPSMISHIILIAVIVNAGLGIIYSIKMPRNNAFEVFQSLRHVLGQVWACFLYILFLFRGNNFLKIFEIWRLTHITYSRKDTKLCRDVVLIGAVIMTSTILENAVIHLRYFRELDEATGITGMYNHSENFTSFESFYWRSNPHWASAISYNWFFAVAAFLQHKWVLYAWNYIDILLAVVGRALYFQFKTLCELSEKKVMTTRGAFLHVDIHAKRQAWTRIVEDHKNLCRILEAVESFFSPVVFGSYVLNVYYLSLQLADCLTFEVSHKGIVHSIYFPWSFLHLIVRCFVVSIYCGKVNVYAHQLRNILQECPAEYYEPEISRLDKRLTFGPDIGLSGLGCFVITKPLILSVFSVLFTFEIVLLQIAPKPASISGCQ